MWSIQRDVGIYKFRSVKHIHDNIPPPFGFWEMLKKKFVGSFPSTPFFSLNCFEIYSQDSVENKQKNYARAEKGGGSCVEPLWGDAGGGGCVEFLRG